MALQMRDECEHCHARVAPDGEANLVVLSGDVNLYVMRLATAAGSMLLLLYGLVWESDKP